MNWFYYCILLCLLLGSLRGASQETKEDKFYFENFNLEEGLSFNEVRSIAKDSTGFVWIGTSAGLNRFDGYQFTTYFNAPKFRRNKSITQLECDKNKLWIGSRSGLYSMEIRSGAIKEEQNLNQLIDNGIVDAIAIEDSTIWCAGGNELFQLKNSGDTIVKSSNISQYSFPDEQYKKGRIKCLVGSEYGLWIGSSYYLGLIDRKNQKIHNMNALLGESRVDVRELFIDSNQCMWIATRQGVYKVNLTELPWKAVRIKAPEQAIEKHQVVAITEDKKGNIYLGSDQKGLMVLLDGDSENRLEFNYNSTSESSIADNDITTLYTDNEGVVWIGFTGNGFDRLTLIPNCFRFYHSVENKTNWIGPHGVSSIVDQDENYFWASSGTSGGGIFRFDKNSGESEYYHHPDFNADNYFINFLNVYNDVLWVNYSGGKLHAIDLKTNEFIVHPVMKYWGEKTSNRFLLKYDQSYWMTNNTRDFLQVFPDEDPEQIHELQHLKNVSSTKVKLVDSKGNFWLQLTGGKLLKYNPKKQQKVVFESGEGAKKLSSTYITCIAEHQNGTIWVGTANGINIIDPTTNRVKQIKRKYGRAFDIIYNIVCDDRGFTWVTTKNVLACFDQENSSVAYYGKEYGIVNCKFNFHSNMKSNDGMLYFGTENKGILAFDPKALISEKLRSKVGITALEVNNQPVLPWKSKTYSCMDVAHCKRLDLKHDQNSISVQFAALSNYLPNTFRYAYRLKGVQNSWQYTTSTNRTVNFSNLPPGNYKLQIKAAKSDGIWTKVKQFPIEIASPWWATAWAYSAYALLFISLLLVIWRYTLRQVALKEQLKLERTRREQEVELNNMKLKFFTNISHEFRTPLTLLLGQLELLLNQPETEKEKRVDRYMTMQRNGNRLLRLINQILDFRKAENRTLKLQAAPCDLVNLLAEITIPFEQMAQQRSIDFECVVPENKEVFADADKVEKVLHNLLSNALKFTTEGGLIRVQLKWYNDQAEIIVEDSGIGISEEHQKNIFKRFYQAHTGQLEYEGTGIGLAYSHDLASLMHGELEVNSEPEKGSIFTFRFPIEKDAYGADEISQVKPEVIAPVVEVSEKIVNEVSSNTTQRRILIIDDEVDVRGLIKDCLTDDFELLEAANGQEGLNVTLEHLPDLIICDVMMPVMDGIAFCKALREDIRISHIPVILLTARTQLEHQIEGIETGADSYITKPFNIAYLQSRVNNLIESRTKLRNQFASSMTNSDDVVMNLPNRETEFIEKVKGIIESNMADPEFRIESIYKEIGMSRTHFFKKIKSLTDKTANEFIKTVKMKHAAQLLRQPDVRINEVAWAVGFADPKYFTKVFKSYYQVTPSEYINGKSGEVDSDSTDEAKS
ncbi:hybrid sensor histidine kinase/response regulator [Prolixibacteraceae bacterium JC049]|nr:hybrid sensor histidine kinase/response regulator [Prolixibacteraceae bacterium JC049]